MLLLSVRDNSTIAMVVLQRAAKTGNTMYWSLQVLTVVAYTAIMCMNSIAILSICMNYVCWLRYHIIISCHATSHLKLSEPHETHKPHNE